LRKNTTTPDLEIQSDATGFMPTAEQIESLSRRLMPEIKKFFADEQIQREFAEWREKQKSAE